jgi:beta-galactosidase
VEPVEGAGLKGSIRRWREWLETDLPAQASFADGAPALVGDGKRSYLAGWPDPALLRGVMADLLRRAGLDVTELPEAVRLRRRGDLTFAFNYGEIDWAAPVKDAGRYLLGGPVVPPQGVACWRAE